MHYVDEFLLSFVIAIALFAAGNIVLFLAWLGNPRSIAFVAKLRRVAYSFPPETVFTCNKDEKDYEVSATVYDSRQDQESTHVACRVPRGFVTPLIWSGEKGRFSVARMKRVATIGIVVRSCFCFFVLVPIVVFGIWLTLAVHWTWIFALLLFLEWLVASAWANAPIIMKYRVFSAFVGTVFFHKIGVIPLWVGLLIDGIILFISPIFIAWAYLHDELD